MECQVNDKLKLKGFKIRLPPTINIRDFGHVLLIANNDRKEKTFITTESYRDLAVELLIAYCMHHTVNNQVWGSNPAYGCS